MVACVCVQGVCISDRAGEYPSILHLDEEINMSDVVMKSHLDANGECRS